jgi:hypothetical protein
LSHLDDFLGQTFVHHKIAQMHLSTINVSELYSISCISTKIEVEELIRGSDLVSFEGDVAVHFPETHLTFLIFPRFSAKTVFLPFLCSSWLPSLMPWPSVPLLPASGSTTRRSWL